jgi:hypothetical protein
MNERINTAMNQLLYAMHIEQFQEVDSSTIGLRRHHSYHGTFHGFLQMTFYSSVLFKRIE